MAAAKGKKEYGNDSISAPKGADRVRKRPGVIFGSDGLEGCEHAVFEILSNAIDEARQGYGKRIAVTRYLDRSVEVLDHGRGCPVGYNPKERKYNWELVFCELYAGGKYDTDAGANYEYSLGLNGLGSCATQYASEFMDVEVLRDGKRYSLHFEKGKNRGGLREEEYGGRQTGTRIRWKPDPDVFTDIDIPLEYYTETIRRQAVVNPGVEFLLRNETGPDRFEDRVFCYEKGIADHVAELAGGETLTPVQYWTGEREGRDRPDRDPYRVLLNVAFCFSNRVSATEYYHNSSFLEYGGSPERAVRSALVSQIDAWLRNNSRYRKDESRITYQDVQDCLVLVSSSFSTRASYENQTKKSVTNKFIYECMTDFLKQKTEVYFIENPEDAAKICNQVYVNKRSREAAESARQASRKKLSGKMDLSNRVEKFVDCNSRDPDLCEVFIVEGDSALGACKQARSGEFQAIMPVRGKILNCLKADMNRIFRSEIIVNVMKVLGCGVEAPSRHMKELNTFSLDNLRWNKIIICTDADVDGFQIRTLILAMLYRLTPTLIEKGYVYIAESPLYEITARTETYFAYDDAERKRICRRLEEEKTRYTLQRSKGLGENEPEMMALTTMNPATRRLIRVTPEGAAATAEMFDLLLGDNLEGRKEYIAENGHAYLDLADIS